MDDIFDIDEFLGRSSVPKKTLDTNNINNVDDILSNDDTLELSSLNHEDETEYKELINKEIKEINVNGILESNGNSFNLKLNCDGTNNEIINKVNKILESYNEIYNEGLDKLSNVGNKRYERLQSEYNKKLNQIKSELLFDNNQKIKRLTLEHENKLKYIENDNESKYKNKISMLEDQISNASINLKEKYEIEISKLKNDLACYDQVTKLKLDNEIEKNNKLEELLLVANKEKERFFTLNNKSNQTKGRDGELQIMHYLESNFLEDDNIIIEDVSKDKKLNSDIYLKYKNLNCVMEIKNFNGNVNENNLSKFENEYINNSNYNCGLFISLNTKFSSSTGKYDFCISNINNKPVIYLAYANDNLDKIRIAIKILCYYLENINNDTKFDVVMAELKRELNIYNSLLKNMITITKSVDKSIIVIKDQKQRIEDIINKNIEIDNVEEESKSNENIKYYTISENTDIIQCKICKKPFSTPKGISYFIKHLEIKHHITKTKEELEL